MTAFVPGNRIELLRSGTEYFPALERAFDAAMREIHLQTYIFEEDVTGRRIAAALARAAQRGVCVCLLIDGFGSKDLDADFVRNLEDQGVQVLKYRPQVSPWTLRRQRLRRLHSKVTVVDAGIAFVGGINIIDDMDTPRQIPPRYDYAVRIEGPVLAQIYPVVTRHWMLARWAQVHRRWPRRVAVALRAEPRGGQRAAFVVRDNLRHRADIENAYLAAIDRARTEILIANAYFFPGRNFRRALIDAAARGVHVKLLLQGRVEYMLLHYAVRALYHPFLNAGIEIHEYQRSFLHAKVAVIDGRWATVGSSNIDPMSLLLAREANIAIEDAAFSEELRKSLVDAIESGAHKVSREKWQRDSHALPMRVMTWVCYGLVRFLTGWSSYGRARQFR